MMRIGHPPADPYGTQSNVIMAGAATVANPMNRTPRGENATMNDAR